MGKKSKITEDIENDISQITENEPAVVTYEERLKNLNPIAKPLAGRKLTKKIYKLIKKACKDKTFFIDGLRQVQLKLRKGEKGLVIFAGDVNPIDIMTHLPGVCEDQEVPYCYVPSRKDLGAAMGVHRSVVTVMVKPKEDYSELYEEVLSEIKALPLPF